MQFSQQRSFRQTFFHRVSLQSDFPDYRADEPYLCPVRRIPDVSWSRRTGRQYRFGARTGGANIYAGIILLAIAALFAGPAVLNLISGGFYGALLVFVALELARYAIKSDSLP